MEELLDLRARRDSGEDIFTHIPTGLPELDKVFGGLEIGILTLLVGHTGDGKSAVMAHLAKAAATAGFGVLLVLLEDPHQKLSDRYLAQVLGMSANKLARLDFGDPRRLAAAAKSVEWARHVALINESSTVEQVVDLVGRAAEKGVGGRPLGLVLVDYAQSFVGAESGLEATCAKLAHGLNDLSKEHGFASVLGSQVATWVLERGRTRWERTMTKGDPDVRGFQPGKGSAMWARRLEQYSKAVWCIFRPGRWEREMLNEEAVDDTIELWVVKANFGPEGSVALSWDGPTATIGGT